MPTGRMVSGLFAGSLGPAQPALHPARSGLRRLAQAMESISVCMAHRNARQEAVAEFLKRY